VLYIRDDEGFIINLRCTLELLWLSHDSFSFFYVLGSILGPTRRHILVEGLLHCLCEAKDEIPLAEVSHKSEASFRCLM